MKAFEGAPFSGTPEDRGEKKEKTPREPGNLKDEEYLDFLQTLESALSDNGSESEESSVDLSGLDGVKKGFTRTYAEASPEHRLRLKRELAEDQFRKAGKIAREDPMEEKRNDEDEGRYGIAA